jgi:hypothetical protein
MSGGLKKQIHPGTAAILILLVLVAVQWVWWRGLVYMAPGKPPGPRGPSPGPPPPLVTILGRDDVVTETFTGDDQPGSADGPGYAARFDRPTGLALDRSGSLYIADTGNNRIRVVLPDGQTATFAGGEQGYADGPAMQARFNAPCGVSVATDGSVYVADTGNNCIRRIVAGQVSTVAGKPSAHAGAAALKLPSGVFCLTAPAGGLMVADTGDGRVCRYRPNGTTESVQVTGGAATAVVGAPETALAIPDRGILVLGAQRLRHVPIDGDYTAKDAAALSLRHPVGLWPFAGGWLVTDNDHGAVFLVHGGKAEVITGNCSSGGPVRGDRGGIGSKAKFGSLTGVVSDGRRYAYVADTANNTIRRLDVSQLLAH